MQNGVFFAVEWKAHSHSMKGSHVTVSTGSPEYDTQIRIEDNPIHSTFPSGSMIDPLAQLSCASYYL